jgi:hypothetical protein
VVVVALAAPAAALAASHSVWVISSPSCITASAVIKAKTQFKPSNIRFGCTQHEGTYIAAQFVRSMKWSKWTGSKAVGTGPFVAGFCKPNCRNEHLSSYPVKVTLAGPKRCPGASHRLFTTATFTFPHKQPPSPTGEGTYSLPCGASQAARDSGPARDASP